jgi:hypothetical protein
MADEHFSRVSLERFFRSALSRQEARELVRHLLRRCPQCTRLLREVSNGESFHLLLCDLEDAAVHSDPDPVEPVPAKVSLFSHRGARTALDVEVKRRGRVWRS